jgi:hypothetical protein
MTRRLRPAAALILATLTLPAATGTLHAAELAGVNMTDSYAVGSERLILNGMAIRDKFFIKVYVGGLYLPKRASNAEEIIRTDTPKALVMQFVRDVKRDKLVQAYNEAFAGNAADMAARQKTNIERFFAFLTDVKEGDRIGFTYEPGKGSRFSLNNSEKLAIEGKEFADLFLLVYIGPHPPTAEVKRGLLGG